MTRRPLYIFCLLFLFFFLIAPAGAVEEVQQTHIKTFDIPTTEGLSISGLEMYDLDPNSNTSFIFNSYGKLYYLNVTSSKSWGWWEFDLSLTDPNGTVETKHLQTLAPAALDWDFYLQYYFIGTDTVFDLDVYASLLPLSANLSTSNPTLSDVLQFSNVACNSSSYFDTKLYLTTAEEFEKQKDQALSLQLKEAANNVFTWTWNGVLNFVGLIPYIGDDLVTAILIASYFIEGIFSIFYLLFIEYRETTILTFEFFIITYSIHRTKSRSPVMLWKNVVNDHIAVYEKIFMIVKYAIDLLTSIISTIAHIIQGIKPI